MPKALKYIGYFLLFIFSFLFFLYWTFPYDVLKDRMINTAAQQLGSDYDVRIGDFSPSFFTGASLKQVKILKHEGDNVKTLWSAAKVKIRASIGSILFGKTNVKFSAKNQKSSISGNFKKTDEGFNFAGSFSNFNIGDLGFLDNVKLTSAIDGDIKLNINKRQMLQSSGAADLELSDIKLAAGDLNLGEGFSFNIPELFLSKGSGSVLQFELSKGAVRIKQLKLADGDLKLDVSGDIFISSIFKNYRMNLKGTFSVTPKMEQAMPFLFMVEKQRQPDGTYPISITGRIGQPSIKIGDFTLPI